jgi:hypothetical protein
VLAQKTGENDVKTSKALSQVTPPHDYRPALQGALSWLGKRYLLAEPLNRRTDDRKPFINVPAGTSASI